MKTGFTEIQINLRRMKLDITNQGSNFLCAREVLIIETKLEPKSNIKQKLRPIYSSCCENRHSRRVCKYRALLLSLMLKMWFYVSGRLTLSWRRPLSYRNQWTGFYMITVSVMKELSYFNRMSCYTYLNKTIAIANVNSGKHLTDVNTLHNNQLPI